MDKVSVYYLDPLYFQRFYNIYFSHPPFSLIFPKEKIREKGRMKGINTN